MLLKSFTAPRDPSKSLDREKSAWHSYYLWHPSPNSLFVLFLRILFYKHCHFQNEFQEQICSSHSYQLKKTVDNFGTVIQIPTTYRH